eukprot:COSAG01_NODE_71602_length_255_cov_0.942308_2_plen_44_part_01
MVDEAEHEQREGVEHLPPGVSTPLFHDKNTQQVGKSQSKRPHKM